MALLHGHFIFNGEAVYKLLYLILAGHLVFIYDGAKASNMPLLYMNWQFFATRGQFLVPMIVVLMNNAIHTLSYTISNRL